MTDATEAGRIFPDKDGDTTCVRQEFGLVVMENLVGDELTRTWTPAQAREFARWMIKVADAIEPEAAG